MLVPGLCQYQSIRMNAVRCLLLFIKISFNIYFHQRLCLTQNVCWRLSSYGIWVGVAGLVVIGFTVEQTSFFLNCLVLKTKARRTFENRLPSDVSYPIILGYFVTVLWEIQTSQKLSFFHIYLFLLNFCIHFLSPKIRYVLFRVI